MMPGSGGGGGRSEISAIDDALRRSADQWNNMRQQA